MAHPPQVVVALGVGHGIFTQGQCRGRLKSRRRRCIEQATEPVEDVRLGDDIALDRLAHGSLNELLVVMQDECQDVGHLAITAFALHEYALQALEAVVEANDRVVVCGSFYTVAEALAEAYNAPMVLV